LYIGSNSGNDENEDDIKSDTDDDNDVAGDGKMKRGLSISSLCEDF